MNEKDVIFIDTGVYGTGIWYTGMLLNEVYNPDNMFYYYGGYNLYQTNRENYNNKEVIKTISFDTEENLLSLYDFVKQRKEFVYDKNLYNVGYLLQNFFKGKILHYSCPFVNYNINENVIVTLHDDYFSLNDLDKVLSFKKAKYKIAITEVTKKRFELFGFENMEVIHLGVFKSIKKLDIDKLERTDLVNELMNIKSKYKIVLTVGVGMYKNNELVCKALMDEKYYHIHIGNDIPLFKCPSKLFKNYINLTLDEMNIVYNFADVYVRPTKQEGFGLPSIELGTLGIPVILSDIETNHEVMGDSAIYIKKYFDVPSIRKGIEEGLSDNQTIKKFNKEYYSYNAYKQRMLNYIHKIN